MVAWLVASRMRMLNREEMEQIATAVENVFIYGNGYLALQDRRVISIDPSTVQILVTSPKEDSDVPPA